MNYSFFAILNLMKQLDLDFWSSPKTSSEEKLDVIPVLKDVWEQVSTIITKTNTETYSFEDKITIGGNEFFFLVSGRIREWSYSYDSTKWKITDITFRLIGEGKKYRFKVSSLDYKIISGENARFNDETLWTLVASIYIGSIQKINKENWWYRFVNSEWKHITNFNYFSHLFWRDPIHTTILQILRRVILDIDKKHCQSSEK